MYNIWRTTTTAHLFHEKQMIFQFISFFKLFLLDFLWFMLLLSRFFFAVPHSSLWFMFRSAAAAAAVETAVIVLCIVFLIWVFLFCCYCCCWMTDSVVNPFFSTIFLRYAWKILLNSCNFCIIKKHIKYIYIHIS